LILNEFQGFSASKKAQVSLLVSVDSELVINKKMPIVHDFKRARLVQSNHKKGWYIQFYVWDVQKNNLVRKKKFLPDRLKTTEAKEIYAKKLIKEVNRLLVKGYHIDKRLTPERILQEEEQNIQLSFKEVIPRYINYCEKVAKNSHQEVSSKFFILKRFLEWSKKYRCRFDMPGDVSEKAAIQFFDDMIEVDGVSGKTYNNALGRLRNFYNVAKKRKWYDGDNPFKAVDKQATGYGEKNIAFTDTQLQEIIPYLKENDPYLHYFIGFIYYALMRPSEIKRLKVRNIDMQKRQIRIEASQSKVKKLDILPIADGLYKILKEMKIENANPDHYLFTLKRKPSEEQMSRSWTTERFKIVKKKFNLNKNYSIYGFKHTAVCKWYEETKDIVRVQRMCRHTSIDMTARYLKSLGLMGDQYQIDSLPDLV
jgi:integrase